MKTQKNTAPFAIKSFALLIGLTFFNGAYAAPTLSDDLERILQSHPLMAGVNSDVNSAKEQIGVEKSAWKPRLGTRANSGMQNVNRETKLGVDGNYSPSD